MNEGQDFTDQGPVAMVARGGEGALVLDLDGFEGPLDLLLTLARAQKVDLRKLSILALADQYLAFIADARRLELELAADYLVMAAWLAYLKSRLLLPEPPAEPGPSGEELAQRLAFQLQRLEAIRDVTGRLFARDRLDRDVFARGAPEGIRLVRTPEYSDTLYDLLRAYADHRKRGLKPTTLHIQRLPVLAIEEARSRLEGMLGVLIDWRTLDQFLPDSFRIGRSRRSGLASTFSATLEMVRDGQLDVQQGEAFGPIYVRRRPQSEETHA
ncbi:MAG: segregation/condensation protein A [Alphaproteobacteria bacterium]|nr:segregation/condensation protein A [Alphaproteobacteria bacterium]